ncbi:MAG: UDP-N-acetylmuramoyl-tripeptide--D-alanyl-D-alanine ligase [Eubacteriales bacterium]|nr:UDP-N-acetylmuramoyl-tripeptide--D-alanyl-D-alanine ligase [Eubacteriales bacterium]
MNDIILYILFGLIFAFLVYYFYHVVLGDFRHYLHMFQLNSYFPDRFANWKKKKQYVFGKASFWVNIFFFIALTAVFVLSRKDFILAFGVWMSVLLSTRKKNSEPVKKPLVYTARIKRMIGVYIAGFILFTAALTILMLPFFEPLYAIMYGLCFSIYFYAVANYQEVYIIYYLLNPFEKSLTRKFYKEAETILDGRSDLIKIGITGSYGKTSTKFILENVLSTKYLTLVTPHSFNTTLGVVRTVREHFQGGLEAFVAEMGAKQTGDIKEICDLVKPKIGIITAVGPQHLETFGSLDNVIATKFELARAIGQDGVVIVNADDSNILTGMKRYSTVNYMTYGEYTDADVRISKIEVSEKGSTFQVTYQGNTHEYQTRLLGKHNISNLTAGIALGLYLGIRPEKIALGIRETKAVEHRLELKMQGNYYILDDAFNSNPVGANNALEVLKSFPNGNKIVMTPGMVELGSEDEAIHYEFGKHMAECVDYAILVGESKTKDIKRGLEAAAFPAEKIHVVKDVFAGFAKAKELIQDGDILLIENDLPDNY